MPITPESFFRLNKSLHLFETHCAFLPLFNPNIDLSQAVKVMKSGHHLSHDWACKGYRSIPCLMSQTCLHACLQRLNKMQIVCDIKQGIDPWPLTSLVVWQMMARFRNFYNVKNSQDLAFNPLTPVPPVSACDVTSSLLTKIGIIYTQLLQEEEIFPMMPRSEWWSAQWSLRYAQKCSKSWVKNLEQNFLPLHLDAPC